jgi:hypothetical protein
MKYKEFDDTIYEDLSQKQINELGKKYNYIQKIKNSKYNSELHEKLKKMLLDNNITTRLDTHLYILYTLNYDIYRSQYIKLIKELAELNNENDIKNKEEEIAKLVFKRLKQIII